MKAIRVLLADDHALVRSGLRLLLESVTGMEVVAEAADGRETLELVHRHLPDVVLLDITMPELNGIEVAARITRQHPRVRVLILSMHADEEYVGQAMRAGAAGYLLKDASSAELEVAIRAVASGHRYLCPVASRPIIEEYLHTIGPRPGPLNRLTARQREVLQLLAEGNSTKDIARKLGVSVKTIETHRAQLVKRLGVHDVPGLVRLAVRTGLISLER